LQCPAEVACTKDAGDASPPPDLKRCWHGTQFRWKSSPKYFWTAHYL